MMIITAIGFSRYLHVREYYADLRAVHLGVKSSLEKILNQNIENEKRLNKRINKRRFHPTSLERLSVLQNPALLFNSLNGIFLFLGLVLPNLMNGALKLSTFFIIYPSSFILIGLLYTGNASPVAIDWKLSPQLPFIYLNADQNLLPVLLFFIVWLILLLIPIIVICYGAAFLITGTIGAEVQREAITDLVLKKQGLQSYLKLLQYASFLGFGFLMGFFLMPDSVFGIITDILDKTYLITPALSLLMFLSFSTALITWLLLIYIRFFSKRIFGFHLGKTPPKINRHPFTFAVAGIILAMYIPVYMGLADIFQMVGDGTGIIELQTLNTTLIATIIALLIYAMGFGLTWLFIFINKTIQNRRCPNCKQPILTRKYMIGEVCKQCGENLAQWLYVD